MSINKISQSTFAQSLVRSLFFSSKTIMFLILNFSQKLNMKQANFSALLSQPFAWNKLSKASKERFLTMNFWLNDPNRMEKLKNHSHFQLGKEILK